MAPAETDNRTVSTHTHPTDKTVSFDPNTFLDDNDKLKPYKFAEALADEYEFAYIAEEDTLYRHVGPCWVPSEFEVEEIARRTFKDGINSNQLGEVERNLRVVTRSTREEIFDLPPHKLVVANGVVNLQTGEFTEGWDTPGTLTWLDVPYDPDAYPVRFESFLQEILHPDDVDIFWKVIGYTLYRGYPFQKAFMFLGDGANGKSTLLNALTGFLGEENVSSVNLHDIVENQFAAQALRGKWANISSDTASRELDASDVFKALTGEDTVMADVKYKQPVEFTNTATMLFQANQMPESHDDTEAYRRRWMYFTFPNTFKGDDAVPQKRLLDQFEQEHSGILTEAVSAFVRLWERGEFEDTTYIKRYGEDAHVVATDPAVAFVEDRLEFTGDGHVKLPEAYDAYKDSTANPLGRDTFVERVERHLDIEAQTAPMQGNTSVWQGYRLVD